MTARALRLTVTFHREVHGGRPRSWWEAVRPTGGRVRGGYMPIGRGVIPHDLGHLVAESHLGITDGVWGLLARGATFKRGTDRRPTQRGRALVAAHRAALHAAEQIGGGHHWAWAMGRSTPVGAAFDRVAARWAEVPDGGTLTVSWPTLELAANPD